MADDFDELVELRAEVERLKRIEALRDILLGEVDDLRHALNEERLKNARLKDAIDGLVMDMGMMEERIRELSGEFGE